MLTVKRSAFVIQVLLHILIIVFKNEEESVLVVSMHNLVEVNDVFVVFQLLEDSNLTNGSAWDSIIAMIYFYLLNSNHFI